MYFSRLVKDSVGGEFDLGRFEPFEYIAIASIHEGVRRDAAFTAIKFKADREPKIAFINPLGDQEIAARWLDAIGPQRNLSRDLSVSDWICFFSVKSLVNDSSEDINVEFIFPECRETDGINTQGAALLFDRAISLMRERADSQAIVTGGRDEIIAILRAIWRDYIIGLIIG